MVKPDAQIALLQQCVDTRWERADIVRKEFWNKGQDGLVHALARSDVQAELTSLWKYQQRHGSLEELAGQDAPILEALLVPMGALSFTGPGEAQHLRYDEVLGAWTPVSGAFKTKNIKGVRNTQVLDCEVRGKISPGCYLGGGQMDLR